MNNPCTTPGGELASLQARRPGMARDQVARDTAVVDMACKVGQPIQLDRTRLKEALHFLIMVELLLLHHHLSPPPPGLWRHLHLPSDNVRSSAGLAILLHLTSDNN